MKTFKILIFLLGASAVSGQIAIGKSSVTSPSVSIEFGDANKGIILPWVTSTGAVTGAVNGTIAYDLSDHKVKVKYNSGWKDLSVDTTGTTIDPLTNVDGLSMQTPFDEQPGAKVTVGAPGPDPGILVLEDTSKAMILPKVSSPHLNIINPAPGMMAYDTTAKQLAVFNGKVWSFWKP
ncbi:hypothetical protein JET18_05035 [Chryseobacterium sp. L7]|uniref:Uncharacterized protein n=1 Tax=Chryseobacterium endalhagicum TaxID=2797638 RepID=A0ABS1QC46_9FLAO|nr:hypothetical protein [Chryseobacterium endalhagicum]MBL1220191.1 hypothetical protein [Chryseobacterium endalhagicum]